MHTLSHIRSLAIAKANTIQRAARSLDALRPAFAEWNSGDIYICKKTGQYRYRYGTESKAVASWDAIARATFPKHRRIRPRLARFGARAGPHRRQQAGDRCKVQGQARLPRWPRQHHSLGGMCRRENDRPRLTMSRTLTVSTLFRAAVQKDSITRNARVPHIRLTGQWLARAGFAPGSRITVALTSDGLVLKKVCHHSRRLPARWPEMKAGNA
jgi:type I toxin-antitoxin system toxin SymE